jgi:hypothetical protein
MAGAFRLLLLLPRPRLELLAKEITGAERERLSR